MKFVEQFNNIVVLKNMFYQEKNKNKQMEYNNQILDLEIQINQHDFAMLAL